MDHTAHGGDPMTDGRIPVDLRRDDAPARRRHRPDLRALRRGNLERETLVLFTSDNGGERYSFNWPLKRAYDAWDKGVLPRLPAPDVTRHRAANQ
jgi:hypothetical protein